MLRTSGVSDLIQLDWAPFIDALRQLPLKEQVEEYNQSRLHELSRTSTVYKFEAEHTILESSRQAVGVVSHSTVSETLIPKDDRDRAGLPRTVSLAVGDVPTQHCLRGGPREHCGGTHVARGP